MNGRELVFFLSAGALLLTRGWHVIKERSKWKRWCKHSSRAATYSGFLLNIRQWLQSFIVSTQCNLRRYTTVFGLCRTSWLYAELNLNSEIVSLSWLVASWDLWRIDCNELGGDYSWFRCPEMEMYRIGPTPATWPVDCKLYSILKLSGKVFVVLRSSLLNVELTVFNIYQINVYE